MNFKGRHSSIYKSPTTSALSNSIKPMDPTILQTTTRNKSPCNKDRFFCSSNNQKSPSIKPSMGENVTAEYTKVPCHAIPRKKIVPIITDKILDAPDVTDDFPSKLIDFSNTGLLAVALGTAVYVCNDDIVTELMQRRTIINSVCWWKDQVVLSGNGKIELWDYQQRIPIRAFESHVNKCVAIASHKNKLATAGYDGIVRVYDYRTDNIIYEYQAHHGEIYDIQFSIDGTQIASCGADCSTVVMSNNRRKMRYHFKSEIQSVSWMPQGILLTGGNDENGTIQQIHTRGNDENRITAISGSPIGKVAWTENWGTVVSHQGSSGIWELWTSDLHRLAKYQCHKKPIMSLAASNDGSHVATISLDETLRIYELSTSIRGSPRGTPTQKTKFHSTPINSPVQKDKVSFYANLR
ncbi:hypothetical protein TRFO_36005 [Tritrichomonas foetus]|uniref:Anaphase-promoting complex subunit 4 WD40 domain-containing protein n=1 Tax=Tritrichomonas foetus TaxID=1144522 RepID=A0A1J4JEU8_9EUKA|nr:hypothetical protein TRFO_36005 [Tritrichomonas foetus]|eukprot:OHS97718.1 hypothetical protein TRFO_36005 [Tritrichomonas foetus]